MRGHRRSQSVCSQNLSFHCEVALGDREGEQRGVMGGSTFFFITVLSSLQIPLHLFFCCLFSPEDCCDFHFHPIIHSADFQLMPEFSTEDKYVTYFLLPKPKTLSSSQCFQSPIPTLCHGAKDFQILAFISCHSTSCCLFSGCCGCFVLG